MAKKCTFFCHTQPYFIYKTLLLTILTKQGIFPHARLSAERVKIYEERITQLIEDFLQEPAEPDGQVYGLSLGLFLSPPYLQEPQDS